MNRFSPRDGLLLSAPLLLLMSGFVWDKWQRRFQTPQISLEIELKNQPVDAHGRTIKFDCQTSMKGGPSSNYKMGWNEKIVASTPRGDRVIWNHNRALNGWNVRAVGGNEKFGCVETNMAAGGARNNQTIYRRYELSPSVLPADASELEWQVEIAAIPSDDNEIWQSPLNSETLTSWRAVDGVAYLTEKVKIPINAPELAPLVIKSVQSKQLPTYFELKISARKSNRRSSRRLVAFDGKTQRILWSDADSLNDFCRTYGMSGDGRHYEEEHLGFGIGKAKASWGEIAFLYDTVYDVQNRVPKVTTQNSWINEKALDAFEKTTGGFRLSKRIVLRPALKLKNPN